MSKSFWDARYSEPDYVYGTDPNRFLAGSLEELAIPLPGPILFPGDGEGRNSVFAAELGYDAVAFDQSDAARDKALRLAESRGVRIEYLAADLDAVEFPDDHFAAVVLIFLHLPPALRQPFHRRAARWVRPGGFVVLEGFTPAHQAHQAANPSAGGPRELDALFTPESLLEDFAGLECVRLEEVEVELAEGPYHRGSAAVVRYIGRRP